MTLKANVTTMGLVMAWLVMGAAGCQKETAPPPPPPPTVSVSLPLQRYVIDWDSYSGYLSSPQTASVAARVSGLIIEAPFHEGSMIHQGDTLFVIDPRPFQADVDNKKAAVAQTKAQADQAEVHFQRYEKLHGTQAISQDDYDAAQAAAEEGKAALIAAQAALETSQLNLTWTRVTAPIAGRVGRMDVTVGNLVNGGSGQTTPLTTIVSTDPLYCYVDVPDVAYLKYRALQALEQRQDRPGVKVPCYLDIQGMNPIAGSIDFIDNSVDASTGTIQVRGVFANPGWLLPGLYGSMRIAQGPPHPVLLVPDTAVVVQQDQRSLMVVGAADVAQVKKVEFGPVLGPLRAVLSGLTPQDRVIVEGVQQAHPGGKVVAHEVPVAPEDIKAFEVLDQMPPKPAATEPSAATAPATSAATWPSAPGPAATEGAR